MSSKRLFLPYSTAATASLPPSLPPLPPFLHFPNFIRRRQMSVPLSYSFRRRRRSPPLPRHFGSRNRFGGLSDTHGRKARVRSRSREERGGHLNDGGTIGGLGRQRGERERERVSGLLLLPRSLHRFGISSERGRSVARSILHIANGLGLNTSPLRTHSEQMKPRSGCSRPLMSSDPSKASEREREGESGA